MEVAARFDYLTSLKNRSYFFERVIDEMERAKRTKSPMVLLVLDVDKFKFVNDTYGHPEGDVVLKKIADNNLFKKLNNMSFKFLIKI